MAEPMVDFKSRMAWEEYLAWARELKKAPGAATQKPDDPGPGALVLCSPATSAVDYAARLFGDRRIEVKPAYADPLLQPPRWRGRLRPGAWEWLAMAGFFTGWVKSDESSEQVKQRMVQLATRLIGIAKDHDEAHFVGEPLMIRLLAFKLPSIGYRGPLTRRIRYGHSYDFEYIHPK
jgi:hypothetical protein